jgi:hypothetical protein
MATRSTISIRNADGSYTGIYCHWDGYLENNGRILSEHYTDEEKIHQLMALGSLSSLAPEIGTKHDFDAAPRGECNAYGRDRGETNVAAVTRPTFQALRDSLCEEYNYLWEDGAWKVECYSTNDRFVTLEMAARLQAADAE